MFTPPSAAPKTPDAERCSFADDAEYYLSLTPRQLPSRYFYDGVGSALFEAICRLPWYGITRTEQCLLELHGRAILARAGRLATLVELGPGAGAKLAALVSAHAGARARGGTGARLAVHLVDVSQTALDAARRALGEYPQVSVEPLQTTYEAGLAELARRPRPAGRTMVLCLGSNLGNFDPPDAEAFLRLIRAALGPGDSLLVGVDLVKPERELLLAYDDPLGVTAAFNLNLLVRANLELKADFDLSGFAHRALWNPAAERVEMHLVSKKRQRVRLPAAGGLDITFDQGETIWTESSYKYRPQGIATLLDRSGFGVAEQWIADGFALTLGDAR
jgi:L-histidine N-alpha-methyltransferase